MFHPLLQRPIKAYFKSEEWLLGLYVSVCIFTLHIPTAY